MSKQSGVVNVLGDPFGFGFSVVSYNYDVMISLTPI